MTINQQACPSCEIRNDIVGTMIDVAVEIFNSTDSIRDIISQLDKFFNETYADIYEEGKREAFSEIAAIAIHSIKDIDGDCEICDECDCED